MADTVRVEGINEFLRAINKADKETKKLVRDRLRAGGEIVRLEASSLFASYDIRSAAGYRVAVRTRGIAVEQRRKRTTGKRPDYGSLQMSRALAPALDAKSDAVIKELEHALDDIANILERG